MNKCMRIEKQLRVREDENNMLKRDNEGLKSKIEILKTDLSVMKCDIDMFKEIFDLKEGQNNINDMRQI